jgi:hypothetical protein
MDGLFDEAEFMKAAEEAKQSKYSVVPNDTYVLEVAKAEIKPSEKSNAVQISLGFKITPDNEKFVGQYIFVNQNVRNKEGKMNHTGVTILNKILAQLSAGEFEPLIFARKPEEELKRFIGTIVRAETTHSRNDEGYDSYRVNIKQLVKNVYVENGVVSSSNTSVPQLSPNSAEVKEIALKIGMPISYKGAHGIISNFVGNTHILGEFTKDGKTYLEQILPSDITVLGEPITANMDESIPF